MTTYTFSSDAGQQTIEAQTVEQAISQHTSGQATTVEQWLDWIEAEDGYGHILADGQHVAGITQDGRRI
jgi:hypothetical protein